jgi:hypothetical protein
LCKKEEDKNKIYIKVAKNIYHYSIEVMASILVSNIFDRFSKGLGECINKYFSL